jgi:tetratricopeptide (TPR) repeat protein
MQNANQEARLDEMISKVQNGSMRMKSSEAITIAGRLYGMGRFNQAINVCRQIISASPTHADAHGILGVSLAAAGDYEGGIASLERAIKLNPKASNFHSNLGELHRQNKNLADAIISLNRALELDPRNAQALSNLGIVRFESDDYDAAVEAYRKAISLNPNFPEAYNNLGNALRKLGETDEASKAYQNALSLREHYPEAYNNLGTLLREQHKPEQAEHALKKAIAQNPRYVEAYNNLAAIYHAEFKDVEALAQLAEALKIEGGNSRSLLLTARIQSRRQNYDSAEKACKIVLARDPTNGEALTVLGGIKHELDEFDEALAVLEKAIELHPDAPEARNYYGICLKSVGRLNEAKEQLLKGLELNDSMYGAFSNLNDLVDFSKEKDLFNKMEVIMGSVEDQEADSLLPLHYAYAKGLDDNGQPEKALQHYIIGGRIKRRQLSYDEKATVSFFSSIKKQFSAEFLKKHSFPGIQDERPLFIIGMPRSGSTLVEQIISSHRAIYGAGEVKHFSRAMGRIRDRFPALSRYPEMAGEMSDAQLELLGQDYLQALIAPAGDAARITDKLLSNYFFVGLLHILFPQAKFVHTRRDPIDTCLSGFTKLFKDDMPHSYDLGELGRYYRQYDALMKHWEKVLPKGVMKTVQYEDVVADTETTAKDLIAFIGLDWDEKCLAFHKSKRPVKTASVAQVRKPIYKTSVERWRKYGDGLKPLIDIINK